MLRRQSDGAEKLSIKGAIQRGLLTWFYRTGGGHE